MFPLFEFAVMWSGPSSCDTHKSARGLAPRNVADTQKGKRIKQISCAGVWDINSSDVTDYDNSEPVGAQNASRECWRTHGGARKLGHMDPEREGANQHRCFLFPSPPERRGRVVGWREKREIGVKKRCKNETQETERGLCSSAFLIKGERSGDTGRRRCSE